MVMAKQKKRRPNLPSGFGSVRRLSGNRRNPWGVYPPVTEWTEAGSPVTPKALAYVSTWQKGFIILQAYHAGTYEPDMLSTLDIPALEVEDPDLQRVIDRMIDDWKRIHGLPVQTGKTLREVYEMWYDWKFEQDKSRTYSDSVKQITQAAIKAVPGIADRPIRQLTEADVQAACDAVPLGKGTVTRYQEVIKSVFTYAVKNDLIDVNVAADLRVTQAPSNKPKGALPESLLRMLWENRSDSMAALILMLCYTGLRISEAAAVRIDLTQGILTGGLKTDAGRDRVIPIHPGIRQLVADLGRSEGLYKYAPNTAKNKVKIWFQQNRHPEMSAHWTRHTFETLCERYDVPEADTARMMGHTVGNFGRRVYSHREIDDLRSQIEKIPCPWDLS